MRDDADSSRGSSYRNEVSLSPHHGESTNDSAISGVIRPSLHRNLSGGGAAASVAVVATQGNAGLTENAIQQFNLGYSAGIHAGGNHLNRKYNQADGDISRHSSSNSGGGGGAGDRPIMPDRTQSVLSSGSVKTNNKNATDPRMKAVLTDMVQALEYALWDIVMG